MYRTDDPIADFYAHEREQQRQLDKLPKCDYCGKRITGEYLFDLDGTICCEKCLNDNFRKATDDYAE